MCCYWQIRSCCLAEKERRRCLYGEGLLKSANEGVCRMVWWVDINDNE